MAIHHQQLQLDFFHLRKSLSSPKYQPFINAVLPIHWICNSSPPLNSSLRLSDFNWPFIPMPPFPEGITITWAEQDFAISGGFSCKCSLAGCVSSCISRLQKTLRSHRNPSVGILETDKSFINRKMGKLMVALVTHRDGGSERSGMKSVPGRARPAASSLVRVLFKSCHKAWAVQRAQTGR